MATIIAEFASDAFVSKVWLDGVRLRFKQGKASKDLMDGRRHALNWVVRGRPSAKYSLSVAAPASIKKVLAKDVLLGDDRLGVGLYEFQL